MKIFAISDLHLPADGGKPMDIFGPVWDGHWEKISADWAEKVSNDDLVLIAGDISWAMRLDSAIQDLEKIAACKGKKIIIRGNHDYWWQSVSKIRSILPPDIHIIQNDAIKFGSTVVCGTRGWTVPEAGSKPSAEDTKLYEREVIRLELSLQAAKKIRQDGDRLVAMIHYPPFNSRFDDSRFTELLEEHSADAVVYGHIHGTTSKAKQRHIKGGIPYYLTSCDILEHQLAEIIYLNKI
ncbi:MAG: metallophosphoesterase [Clostridia bacterium]